VQHADDVVRTEAEKNEDENAPAGAKALVSEEDAMKEARLGSVLRGRSGEGVNGQSGGVGLHEVRIVQEISLSLELVVIRLSPINLCGRNLKVPISSYLCAVVVQIAPFTSGRTRAQLTTPEYEQSFKPPQVPQAPDPVWRLSLPIGRRHPYHTANCGKKLATLELLNSLCLRPRLP